MQTTIMVTNGGPHAADRWADLTAGTIVDTILVDSAPNDASDAAIKARAEKRKLRGDLFEIFNAHHDGVQRIERDECAKCKKPADAAARVIAPLDHTPHMSIMDLVNTAFAKTAFSDHFKKPEVQELVEQIVGQHTTDVMHIERRWHHDKMTTKGA